MQGEGQKTKESRIKENLLERGPKELNAYIEEKERDRKAQLIKENIEKIEKEQKEIEITMQSTLEQVVKKLSSVGVDILACTALDIEGTDITKKVEYLKKYHALKESNERALLRLKTSSLSEEFLARQNRIDRLVESLRNWMQTTKKSVEEVEESIMERASLSEVCTGSYVVDKYKKFIEDIEPVEYILENACSIAQKHSKVFTPKDKTDFAISESFIKISSHEERVLRHLLSLMH